MAERQLRTRPGLHHEGVELSAWTFDLPPPPPPHTHTHTYIYIELLPTWKPLEVDESEAQ